MASAHLEPSFGLEMLCCYIWLSYFKKWQRPRASSASGSWGSTKKPLFILVKFHVLYLIIYNTPHFESHRFFLSFFFFFFLFKIKSPHGCTIQTSVFGCHEGEYLQSDSIQVKSPPAGCLVWSCPFSILSKWFYCLSFHLLRDNCTNQVICSLKSDS